MPVRIAFLGSPEFAVPSLRALAASPTFSVVIAVTQPDRPAGRGRKLTPPPVATAARELGVDTIQPHGLRDAAAVQRLRDAKPDVLVVVAYGELLRRDVLELAPHGALNVHPSLLPRYRGAAPIPAAILAGDAVAGTSIIRLVRRLDAGPIVAQVELDITPDDTSASLGARLADQAADLLPDTVDAWVAGRLTAREQDETLATYTHEWSRDDARIDWSLPATQIERLVRAANPWPIAWTTIEDRALLVHSARIVTSTDDEQPGQVQIHTGQVVVATGNATLELLTVQPAGRRAMSAADWLRGLRRSELMLGR